MKSLSLFSLALVLGYLMPVFAVRKYICDGDEIPERILTSKIEESIGNLGLAPRIKYKVNEERDSTTFLLNSPNTIGKTLKVTLSYDLRGEILSLTATHKEVDVTCNEA
ncbi:BgTH12-06829 [Blumeria graminis f. sp. triticale]|uniref:BgTH12-06829 n=1 Tax=Blumeria graminis f. sp. triticale TaxID=1689686 RepID=A0A9W4GHR6_BLUGR|nr:BgTH12-06829 [Blumeria graminis f. sp. triticale]